MGMNSLSNTVTRQRRDCDLNPGPSAPESSTLTIRLPSHSTIPHNKSESVLSVSLFLLHVRSTSFWRIWTKFGTRPPYNRRNGHERIYTEGTHATPERFIGANSFRAPWAQTG